MKVLIPVLMLLFIALCRFKVYAPEAPITWNMPDSYYLVQKTTLDNGLTIEVWREKERW